MTPARTSSRHRWARRAGALPLAALVAVTLAACSDDDTGSETTPGATAGADAAFPVTITHTFGETVITEAPERVVSSGTPSRTTSSPSASSPSP